MSGRRTVLFMERKPIDVIEAKRAAHLRHGRSRKEITGCLGLHNSTVSSILKGKCWHKRAAPDPPSDWFGP